MRIAIIDSGIDSNHKRLKDCDCKGISLDLEPSGKLKIGDDYNDRIGHGTGIAAIIHRIVPSAVLMAVKVFHQDLIATERHLCESLKWCLDNDVDIINLSLGILTQSPSEELYRLCLDAYKQGIVIVSAAHANISHESYPAYFSTVFGVTWGKVNNTREYGFIPNSPIEFIAKGTLQRVAWREGGFTISSGTSLACAYFTGITAHTLQSFTFASIDILKDKLKDGAILNLKPLQVGGKAFGDTTPVVKSSSVDRSLEEFFKPGFSDWIGNLGVFPASEKEMRAFSEFQECCVAPVVQYFDYPRNLTGSSPDIDNSLNSDSDLNLFERFDTLVTGYFADQLFETNIRYGSDLLKEALSYGKNVYSYDHRLSTYIERFQHDQECVGKVYIPETTERHYQEILPFRYLTAVKIPVLCVLGTSNRQGKFTTQLRIKSILEREGYDVGFVSTEPQGELFGATYSFPYGYRGTVSLDKKKWTFFLRILSKGIQEHVGPHLILAGTQGTSIPRERSRKLLGNETDTLDFVTGINPDTFVCAINPQDTISYIADSCEVYRIYCGAEPIFFVMTPWMREFQKLKTGRTISRHRFLSDEEKHVRLNYFQDQLGKPVFDIMDSANDQTILEIIQEYFS